MNFSLEGYFNENSHAKIFFLPMFLFLVAGLVKSMKNYSIFPFAFKSPLNATLEWK
jgi:hypothetical protein